MSRNCTLNRTEIRTRRAASTFCCGGQKNLGGATKISPKVQQYVIVLFLLAASAASGQQDLLRLEKSADAMGSTYSIAVYGADRVKMEAAVDAAFDEVRRLDELLSNYLPGQPVERGQPERRREAGQGFAGAVPAAFGLRRRTAARVKGRSISRWDR